MQAKQQMPISTKNQNAGNQTKNPLVELKNYASNADADVSTAPNADDSSPSIKDYSEQQAQEMIDKMPDYVLGQYVDK
ncbi:hypothetical protein, partial [Psychrobacter sp. CAL346-MNA-CIBAN-0220]